MDLQELAWAAGLFEGEGCFTLSGKKTLAGARTPAAQIKMNDEDIMSRFAAVLPVGKLRVPAPSEPKMWRWRVYGFEGVQATAALLWFGLGVRRRQRVAEVLKQTGDPLRPQLRRNPRK